MCIAIPGQIISINESEAVVNIMGIETTVNIQLLQKVTLGDFVLIHAGCAIEKMNPDEFQFLETTYKHFLTEDEMKKNE